VFSFMQGWRDVDVESFITWVSKSLPSVVVITGHASGEAGIVSPTRLADTWARMSRYSLRRKIKVTMAGGGGLRRRAALYALMLSYLTLTEHHYYVLFKRI
jgi:hypothetical protein